MEKEHLCIAIIKLGCIGSSPLFEFILDERASRSDITVRTFGSGSKLDEKTCSKIGDIVLEQDCDIALVISPNASLPGPTLVRNRILDAYVPTIVISDIPAKKAFFNKDKTTNTEEKLGFILVSADPMIGARKAFLDPTEMVIFNSHVLSVLSTCGFIRYMHTTIDLVLDELKIGNALTLPKVILDVDTAIAAAEFSNPYAEAKAYAAARIAENVSSITTEACFKEANPARYMKLVSAAHEMIRAASKLADRAREIEKSNDTVLRTPHSSDGKLKVMKHLSDEY